MARNLFMGAIAGLGRQLRHLAILAAVGTCALAGVGGGGLAAESVPQRPSTLMVLDLSGDGFAFTSPQDGVLFSFDESQAKPMGWIAAGADDAVLVLDRDGNGTIDGGHEMLGTRFRLTAKGAEVSSGADALMGPLQGIQTGPDGRPAGLSAGAGVIDGADTVFAQLQLWRDRTRDGRVQPGELASLADASVTSIRNGYRRDGMKDQFGNTIRLRGTFTVRARGVEFERHLVEVEFGR